MKHKSLQIVQMVGMELNILLRFTELMEQADTQQICCRTVLRTLQYLLSINV